MLASFDIPFHLDSLLTRARTSSISESQRICDAVPNPYCFYDYLGEQKNGIKEFCGGSRWQQIKTQQPHSTPFPLLPDFANLTSFKCPNQESDFLQVRGAPCCANKNKLSLSLLVLSFICTIYLLFMLGLSVMLVMVYFLPYEKFLILHFCSVRSYVLPVKYPLLLASRCVCGKWENHWFLSCFLFFFLFSKVNDLKLNLTCSYFQNKCKFWNSLENHRLSQNHTLKLSLCLDINWEWNVNRFLSQSIRVLFTFVCLDMSVNVYLQWF